MTDRQQQRQCAWFGFFLRTNKPFDSVDGLLTWLDKSFVPYSHHHHTQSKAAPTDAAGKEGGAAKPGGGGTLASPSGMRVAAKAFVPRSAPAAGAAAPQQYYPQQVG